MKYFVRRFHENPENKFLITKEDAVYALVLGTAIILCLGATLLFIVNKIQAKQIDNLLSPKLAEMYSFIVNAANEEYEDVAQEIRHSLIRTSYNMDDLDLLDKMPNTSANCPLDSEHLEGQVYLVAFNTGELYKLDGGYGTFDRMAAATVRKIKKNYPDVELVLIIAYLPTGQDREYGKEYDATIYPSGLETVPQKFAIAHRNRWIVNNSNLLITYIHHHGGAAAAVKYAKTRNVSINNI